jgi:hypothetical protein
MMQIMEKERDADFVSCGRIFLIWRSGNHAEEKPIRLRRS